MIGIGRRVTITTVCVEGIWRIFEDTLPYVIYTGHCSMSSAKFEGCVSSDMEMIGTCVSPSLSGALISISTLLSSSVSAYMCLPPPVRSVHFSIERIWWRIAVEGQLRGVHQMLGVGWLPHHLCIVFDDVSTPVFHRALVIVIRYHILESL